MLRHHLTSTRPRRRLGTVVVAVAAAAAMATSACDVPDPGPTEGLPDPRPALPAPVTVPYVEGPYDTLRIDYFPPTSGSGAEGPDPVIVFLHGGGFYGGSRATLNQPVPFAAPAGAAFVALRAEGWALASIDYGLSTQLDETGAGHVTLVDQVLNAKRAIQYLRANATTLDLDPDNVVVAGESAGGTIATIVALTPGIAELEPVPMTTTVVQGVVNFDGPLDLEGFHASAVDACATSAASWSCDEPSPFPAGQPAQTGATFDRFGPWAGFAEYLPAASNCESGDFASSGCEALVASTIADVSPMALVDELEELPADVPPMYLACIEENSPIFPAALSCDTDHQPFAARIIDLTGDPAAVYLDQLEDGWHPGVSSFVNYAWLSDYLDWVRGT